jgi:glyceraldehyde 3-phosphate dehydrogenase
VNILLNGLGRIGKAIFRISLKSKKINIVSINELNQNIQNIAYNINYDSTYGILKDKFKAKKNIIENKNIKVKITHYLNLKDIPLDNIDILIDASGTKQDIKLLNSLDIKHIILTHPHKDIKNIILGINEQTLTKKDKIISSSSCNATALLPLLKLLDDNFKVKYGDITTIHPLLSHQKVLDSNCIGSSNRDIKCNYEFGRGTIMNIIPSQTTTVEACSYILPHFNNILTSSSLRVPTQTVGAINITLVLDKPIQKNQFIKLAKKYQKQQKYKIFYNNFEPLVSSDFKASKYTTIIDHRYTQTKQNMIKVIVWYDNEWGYASKVVDIILSLKN